MGEVGKDPKPAVELFETEEDEENDWPEWVFPALLALGSGALGLLLHLKWDSFVDGHYSRRRGGPERILDELGQGTTVNVLLAIAALGLVWALWALRSELTKTRGEEAKGDS